MIFHSVLLLALSLGFFFQPGVALEEFRTNPEARLWVSSSSDFDNGHRMLGGKKILKKPSLLKIDALTIKNEDELPENFDSRDNWPQCKDSIGTVRDQSYCESCWAVASASVMSDLTCIACNGDMKPYISDEDLITCCLDCSSTNNCEQGGYHDRAFQYWVNQGVVTGGSYVSAAGCSPYTVSPNVSRDVFPPMPECGRRCQYDYPGNYPVDKHKGQLYQVISGERDMQLALYHFGPLATSFLVYKDFQKRYFGGIYHWTNDSGEFQGGHVVKVIGWGVENGTKYWLAANSWGTKWGMNGFFKILRGTNECEFESEAVFGVAARESCFEVVKHELFPETTSTTTDTSTTTTTTTSTPASATTTTTTTKAASTTTTTTTTPSSITTTTPTATTTVTAQQQSSASPSSTQQPSSVTGTATTITGPTSRPHGAAGTLSPFRFSVYASGWLIISVLKLILF